MRFYALSSSLFNLINLAYRIFYWCALIFKSFFACIIRVDIPFPAELMPVIISCAFVGLKKRCLEVKFCFPQSYSTEPRVRWLKSYDFRSSIVLLTISSAEGLLIVPSFSFLLLSSTLSTCTWSASADDIMGIVAGVF